MAHLLGAYEAIIENVASQKIVTVAVAAIFTDGKHSLLRDDGAVLGTLALSLHGGKVRGEVLADIVLLHQPSRKAAKPREVIVSGSGSLPAIEPKPVEELRDNR